jgi:NTF2-like N-terminal transpeptidase domain
MDRVPFEKEDVKMSRVIGLVLAFGFLSNACTTLGPSPQEVLDRSIFSYHQHLRWQRFDKAANFVDKEQRESFTKNFEGAEDTLSIDDLEIKDIKYEDDEHAKVTVETRFFKLPSVTLQKTKWVQEWVRKGEEWWLVKNARGPFFPDATPASAPTL